MTNWQSALLRADMAARCSQNALVEAVTELDAEMTHSAELRTDAMRALRRRLLAVREEIASVRRELLKGANR